MNAYQSFPRYLNAKKSVDDRALNQNVWQTMKAALPDPPLRILELGAGIGTMIERLVEREVLTTGIYAAIDSDPVNVAIATRRLAHLRSNLTLQLEAIDLFDFIQRERGQWGADLLIAHAFLDLFDLAATLPDIFSLLKPGGCFYFSINFDGGTIFEPIIDHRVDDQIEHLYHRTMDRRRIGGRPAGDSRSGRHLFTQIPAAGGEILASGSSDWVVFSKKQGYPADEAYFLHFIIETMRQALCREPELDQERFAKWIDTRHSQIERGELVYIAHQLDFFGRRKSQ